MENLMNSDNPFMDKIGITLDIDWVSDTIIKYVVDLLERYQVKATLFATHESAFLESLDKKKFEVEIHPNFTNSNDWDKIIRNLKDIYSDAIGVRSHGLTQSSIIHGLFINNGLKYEVNTFIPLREGLSPYCRPRGNGENMVCIPFYWEDDGHFLNSSIFDISRLRMNKKGLKIYNFHPMHVFMNTKSDEHYESYKQFYHQPDVLMDYRWKGKGIGTLFIELLQYLKDNKIPTYTCKEIYEEYMMRGECDELY